MSARYAMVFALVPIAFSVGCAAHAAPAAWSYDEHVGVASALGGRSCFATKASSLAAKTPLRIVDPGPQQQQEQRQATIVAASDACLDDSDRDTGLRGYTIQFEGGAPQMPFLGIGVVGATAPFRAVNDALVADLDGDRHDEFFRVCTSSEGAHFTIWTNAPLTGSRRWHQYRYLGYDVTPSCTPAETAAP